MSQDQSAALLQINRCEHNPFDDNHHPDEPEAEYSLHVSSAGSRSGAQISLTLEEVRLIMVAFDVSRPAELVGRTWSSQVEDQSQAIRLLVLQQRYRSKGLEYRRPSQEEIHQRAARALSRMLCPDFSDVEAEIVASAFVEAFEGYADLNQDWLQRLQGRLAELSQGLVSLEQVDYDESFGVWGKGSCACMMLRRGQLAQRLVFYPNCCPPLVFIY